MAKELKPVLDDENPLESILKVLYQIYNQKLGDYETPESKAYGAYNLLKTIMETHVLVEGWRSIESAPKDRRPLLLLMGKYGNYRIGFYENGRWLQNIEGGTWSFENGRWLQNIEGGTWSFENELEFITHWMPLPPAPSKGGE